jgi:hypothetical protein
MMRFNVQRLKDADNGTKYVALPDKLVAIWWAKRPAHALAIHGGNAA